MSKLIQLPQFQREAEVRSASFDGTKKTVEVVWTTGRRVSRNSWEGGKYEEELVVSNSAVRLGRLNAGAPFLNSHDSSNLDAVIGTVVPGSARIEAGQGLAKIKLSARAENAGIVKDISEGVIRNISVGYRIYTIEKTERRGDVPLHRVTDWEPWEISAVPIPADPAAQVRDGGSSGERYACKVLEGDDLALAISNRMRRRQMEMAMPLPSDAFQSAHNRAVRNRMLRRELEAKLRS